MCREMRGAALSPAPRCMLDSLVHSNLWACEASSHAAQASLTVRKQNKKFAVYDLNLTLGWEGEWAAGDAEEEPAKVCGVGAQSRAALADGFTRTRGAAVGDRNSTFC